MQVENPGPAMVTLVLQPPDKCGRAYYASQWVSNDVIPGHLDAPFREADGLSHAGNHQAHATELSAARESRRRRRPRPTGEVQLQVDFSPGTGAFSKEKRM